jgi:hypothetical protein
MAVFFISDTHFGDHRVLNLYPRPFASVAAMDTEMIARWNAAIGEETRSWHLGVCPHPSPRRGNPATSEGRSTWSSATAIRKRSGRAGKASRAMRIAARAFISCSALTVPLEGHGSAASICTATAIV